MRLVNTKTLQVEERPFLERTPQYAILSHTWGDEEVTLQELASPNEKTRRKSGYAKIEQTCKKALEDNLQYAWVDTCCIDKTSSAELSEAINSMFHWYEKAEVCYAYLADVQPRAAIEKEDSDFARSRWFTRGWTLQELIAPSKLLFFASDWSLLSERSAKSEMISKITRIDERFLQARGDHDISRMLAEASTAEKFSWASRRCTTRSEDMAYCLLGLFSINIPLIYGEGPKAFLRLQKEIVQHSNDQSLFAWENKRAQDVSHSFGIFAGSPASFANSGNIVPVNLGKEDSPPFSVTNNGLHITMPIFTKTHPRNKPRHYGLLQCQDRGDPTSMIVAPLTMSHGSFYRRLKFGSLDFVDRRAWFQWPKSPIYIAIDRVEEDENKLQDFFFIRKVEGLDIESMDSSKLGMKIPLGDVQSWRCGEKKCIRSLLISSGDTGAWLTLSARKVYSRRSGQPIIWTDYSFSRQNRSNPTQIPDANVAASKRLLRVEGGAFYAELSNQDIFGKRVFVVDVVFISSTEVVYNLRIRTQLRGTLNFALACLERLCPQPFSKAAWMLGTTVLDIYFYLVQLERRDIIRFLLCFLIFIGLLYGFEIGFVSWDQQNPAFSGWIGTVISSSWFFQRSIIHVVSCVILYRTLSDKDFPFSVLQGGQFQPYRLLSSRSDTYIIIKYVALVAVCIQFSISILIGFC
ncbi:HET domain containing protein [Hyaloscypha variabilis]